MATTQQPKHTFNVQIAPDVDGTEPDAGDFLSFDTWMSTYKPDGGDRATSATYVSSLASPIVMAGKRGAVNATIELIYTSGTAAAMEDYDQLRTWFDNQTPLWIKHYPQTGDTARYFVSGPGYLTNVPAPDNDAGSADPLKITASFTMNADSRVYPAT